MAGRVPSEHGENHKDLMSKARVIKRVFRLAGERNVNCELLSVA